MQKRITITALHMVLACAGLVMGMKQRARLRLQIYRVVARRQRPEVAAVGALEVGG